MATIRNRSGKFHVQVRRKGQSTATKSFLLKKDAETWARQMEVLADKNDLPDRDRKALGIRLHQLVVRYLETVVSRKRCAEYETIILSAFLRHPLCQKPLKSISTKGFAAYRDERLCSIKPASLRRQLNPIQNMFEVARDEWGIPLKENPLDKLKLKAPDNRRERRLREGEYERLLSSARTRKNPYIEWVIVFAVETAMRRGERLAPTEYFAFWYPRADPIWSSGRVPDF